MLSEAIFQICFFCLKALICFSLKQQYLTGKSQNIFILFATRFIFSRCLLSKVVFLSHDIHGAFL